VTTTARKLFITYAWDNNKEGDFDYIAQQLRSAGLDVRFDRVQFTAGKRLWEQIGETIASSDIDGWAYLITPQSLLSEKCKEEYYLALGRALDTKGADFPLITLMYNARFEDLPPSLRMRLGVSLSDPHWIERVVASVERRDPALPKEEFQPIKLAWRPGVQPAQRALEITPRITTLGHWRVAVPLSHKASVVYFTEALSGALPSMSMLTMSVSGDFGDYYVVGAQGPIGNGVSAYILFKPSEPLPPYIIVGGRGSPDYRIDLPV